jgi:uncharacterized membrane protein
MGFCPNCGTAVPQDAGFCGNCGRAISSGTPVAQMASAPQSVAIAATQSAPAGATASGLTPNVAGALAYLLGLITGIIFLALEPYKHDRFVRFHAMQSILLSATYIVYRITFSFVVRMIVAVSGWLALALVPVAFVISLGLFVFWLFLMYSAYKGREFQVPVIGPMAARQAGE